MATQSISAPVPVPAVDLVERQPEQVLRGEQLAHILGETLSRCVDLGCTRRHALDDDLLNDLAEGEVIVGEPVEAGPGSVPRSSRSRSPEPASTAECS